MDYKKQIRISIHYGYLCTTVYATTYMCDSTALHYGVLLVVPFSLGGGNHPGMGNNTGRSKCPANMFFSCMMAKKIGQLLDTYVLQCLQLHMRLYRSTLWCCHSCTLLFRWWGQSWNGWYYRGAYSCRLSSEMSDVF